MSAPILLHLMRHGEPVLTGTMLGRTDSPATPAGVAACVAQTADLAFARVVSSDLSRTRACAAAIGEAHGISPDSDPRWGELDFGAWDGLAMAVVDPVALQRFWDDPDAFPPPGGERWSDLTGRIAAAVDAVELGATLVVTHGGAMRAALGVLCGFSRRQLWSFDLPYAVVVTLAIWPGPERTAQIVAIRPVRGA